MSEASIVVQPPRGTGGRRVTIRGQIVGLAYSDRDLAEILRRAGIEESVAEDMVAGDSQMIEWRGGRAHHYKAA